MSKEIEETVDMEETVSKEMLTKAEFEDMVYAQGVLNYAQSEGWGEHPEMAARSWAYSSASDELSREEKDKRAKAAEERFRRGKALLERFQLEIGREVPTGALHSIELPEEASEDAAFVYALED